MNNKRATKRALLTSVMALVMCVVMLVGTTFAWFTDTASTGVNKIQAGNLDIELEMKNASGGWDKAEGKTLPFLVEGKIPAEGTQILWEPGCRYELPELRIVNKGNLALKYKVIINGIEGDAKLNEAIDWTITYGNENDKLTDDINKFEYKMLPKAAGDADYPSQTFTIKGTMKEEAGNEYQGLSIDGIGITVVATQYTYEKDSIDDQYDANANATIQVNKDNIQDYLDGKYGSIDGMTLVLAAGDYDKIEFGRATAYEGSNTKYYLKGAESTPDAIKQAIAAHPHGGAGTPTYIRSMNNVTLKAADGVTVTVAGIDTFGGQAGAGRYDYVVERAVTSSNDCYYLTHRWNNIVFEGISFTDAVNIDAFQNATVINGIKFDNCSFTVNDDTAQTRCLRLATGGDCKSTGLAVTNCKFYDGFEGVLTIATTDVTVSGCTFTGLSKNAIDLLVGTNGYGKVTVTNNTIQDMGNGDGVILRLGDVDAKAALTIKDNTASGVLNFKGNLAIKVNSLANGITYDISNNNWGSLGVSHTELNG